MICGIVPEETMGGAQTQFYTFEGKQKDNEHMSLIKLIMMNIEFQQIPLLNQKDSSRGICLTSFAYKLKRVFFSTEVELSKKILLDSLGKH